MAELGNYQGHSKGGTKGILRWATQAAQKIPENWEELLYTIKEKDILSVHYINSDQTQVMYVKTEAKQISTVGNDEKCAFTIMVFISNDGTLLPLQAIYQGYSKGFCLSQSALNYENCLLQIQKTIWQIDVWSMHRSEEFHSWMKIHHPTIGLHYNVHSVNADDFPTV
ncbi:uncharacterized protein F5147DRAFT_747440 [Suillus discolor]|uniref:DDE-1 domain-containing protein n=1 Tax=Suillus discolor TaxID=1912936 RepID=A0A9P7EY81_9AGAM|nr:uncharacterized protein F5147DRAFT_747440 [Suillus discolor]KAG2097737.1 hypothetical protein F5147DRAFT_747440 [Suillus discolor]